MKWKMMKVVVEKNKEMLREIEKEFPELFSGERKAYIVFDYGIGQVDLEKVKPEKMAISNPDFFKKNNFNMRFVELVKRKKKLKNKIEKMPYWKKENKKFEKLIGRMEKLEKALSLVDKDELSFKFFTVELRFPTLNMELIQKVKYSKFCDKNRTEMSKACIKVVLNVFSMIDWKKEKQTETKYRERELVGS